MPKTKLNPRKDGLQDRAKETVNFIIQATTQLLEEKGLKGLSTNKIVERAGISIGTLYQYFPNKESIIHHLLQTLFNNMADDMVNTIQGLDLEGKDLKTAVKLLVDRLFTNHERKKTLMSQFMLSVVSVEHLKFMLKNDARVTETLKEKFHSYFHELNLEDLDASIFIILYALKGIQFGLLFGESQLDHEKTKTEVSKLIYNYLAHP
jgi:AcrR family transcriptional regulator